MPPIPKRKPRSIEQRFLGIDPGQNGGIALVDANGKVIDAWPMPETDMAKWILISAIADWKKVSIHAVIEKVHSMPKQGVASVFTFGKGYGGLLMALTAAKIPFEEVTPQKWQKCLGIVSRSKEESKPDFKKRLWSMSQKLHPKCHIWDSKFKGKQLAVADALLLATYAHRFCGRN